LKHYAAKTHLDPRQGYAGDSIQADALESSPLPEVIEQVGPLRGNLISLPIFVCLCHAIAARPD